MVDCYGWIAHLVPRVSSVEQIPGSFDLSVGGHWFCSGSAVCEERIAELLDESGYDYKLSGCSNSARLRFRLSGLSEEQAYTLLIEPDLISISAADDAGLYYGALTLFQLVGLQAGHLSCCRIEDAPSYPVRGVMLDISRDKVPSMQTLFDLISKLSRLKINHLQLYMEHTFAYSSHECVWRGASPLTAGEIKALDKYCIQHFIDLVPNQNSFGHMERWLVLPRYNALAALPEGGAPLPWGGVQSKPTALNPQDKRSLLFLDGLYSELLPCFSSTLFNVGCDEVFGLSISRCSDVVQERGEGRIYLEFLQGIFKLVKKHGKTPAFWGDIIVKYPELVAELPGDVIALEWGYEADHPFESHTRLFSESGLNFYVCPGTSSWNSIAGRHDNMVANILSAADSGLRHGAGGVVVIDWGDYGHWQPLSVSYASFAFAAALAWGVENNRDVDLQYAVSKFFAGGDEVSAGILIELANIYKDAGALTSNSSVLFHLLYKDTGYEIPEGVSLDSLRYVEERLDFLKKLLPADDAVTRESSIVRMEIIQMIRLLRAACFRGRAVLESKAESSAFKSGWKKRIDVCVQEQRKVWLLRNREGGLDDSLARLKSCNPKPAEPEPN